MNDKTFIDLGKKWDEAALPPKDSQGEERVSYPSLYITSDSPLKLGDKGEAVIKYKKVESTESMRDGKHSYRCELEVHGIKPTASSEASGDSRGGDEDEMPKSSKGFRVSIAKMKSYNEES